MGKVRLFLSLSFLVLLTACYGGRQENYYQSYVDAAASDNLVALNQGDKPEVIFSENIEADKEKYKAQGFVIVGESSFENREQYRSIKRKHDSHVARAVGQAMRVSATHVLYNRTKVNEYISTAFSKIDGHKISHYEEYQNHSVYLVKNKI
ncbi:hypothetical protein [Pseudemcibacter aquimaris]|uniref:hypothetical protein n=1 Tax=Pseudemcibacter aquimaris TaxID=2857064 RepID=UPI002012F1FE|nr:hypothetical protein [Pseudemcibacter aquimaris]MCC3860023.1 hypothetical protein [Pseudemcibacter aquimaris]WDU57353.1 hypothetical protein KW060_09095 [Pseudemcibacter aquimaris]